MTTNDSILNLAEKMRGIAIEPPRGSNGNKWKASIFPEPAGVVIPVLPRRLIADTREELLELIDQEAAA